MSFPFSFSPAKVRPDKSCARLLTVAKDSSKAHIRALPLPPAGKLRACHQRVITILKPRGPQGNHKTTCESVRASVAGSLLIAAGSRLLHHIYRGLHICKYIYIYIHLFSFVDILHIRTHIATYVPKHTKASSSDSNTIAPRSLLTAVSLEARVVL